MKWLLHPVLRILLILECIFRFGLFLGAIAIGTIVWIVPAILALVLCVPLWILTGENAFDFLPNELSQYLVVDVADIVGKSRWIEID